MPLIPADLILALYTFFIALASVLVLTPLVIRLAPRLGFIAHPAGSRWHKEPTPLMGGLAIFAGVVISLLFFSSPLLGSAAAGLYPSADSSYSASGFGTM